MRTVKIILGGTVGFIALGTVLESFSIPKPAEIYRFSPQKTLIGYFLIFYPILFMVFGSIAGGCLTAFMTKRKSE